MDKFAGTNIATSAGGEILGSRDAAIESGNTLDFVMASRSVAGLVRLSVDKVVPFAPHFPPRRLLILPTTQALSIGLRAGLPLATVPAPSRTNRGTPPHSGRPRPLPLPSVVLS